MPYDPKTGRFRAYSEDELKAIRPDWYPKPAPNVRDMFPSLGIGSIPSPSQPAPSSPLPANPNGVPNMTKAFPQLGIGQMKPIVPQQTPQAPQQIVPQAPQQVPNATSMFPQLNIGSFVPPTQPAANFSPQTMFPQLGVGQFSPESVLTPQQTTPQANAMMKAITAPTFNFRGSGQPIQAPQQQMGDNGVTPKTIPEAWQTFKQFAGSIDQAVRGNMGSQYIEKLTTGKDLPGMTKEYAQYVQEAKRSGAEPMKPQEYFQQTQPGKYAAGMWLSDSDEQRIMVDSGAAEKMLSPGMENVSQTFGAVLGQGAVMGPAGKLGSILGERVMASPLLRNAPGWIKKTISSITGAATAGTSYQTGMEALQEAAYPDQQGPMGHAKDIGNTALYWGAYGAMGPAAEKLMEKAGGKLPPMVTGALDRFPATKEIGRNVVEGGITGLGVGGMMFTKEMLSSGDPQKAWDKMTGESKQEMLENFAESILYAFMKRGPGKIQGQTADVLDNVYHGVYKNLSSDLKGEWDSVIQYAQEQGYDEQTAKNVVMDYFSQSKDGEIAIGKATQDVFSQQFQNSVLEQSARAPMGDSQVAATQEAQAAEQAPAAPNPQDLMNAEKFSGPAQGMLDALNQFGGQENEARRQVDPFGTLEGFSAVPQPAAPVGPETRPAPVTGAPAGPRQPFAQGDHVRVTDKPGLFQVASDQEGKKRKLIAPDGSTVEVHPTALRKSDGLTKGDQVSVSGRDGVFTVNNMRDGKTIRLTAPNGTIADVPANKIQPHFATPVTAATNNVEAAQPASIAEPAQTVPAVQANAHEVQQQPAAEHQTDSIGGSEITMDSNEQPVDTTGDPAQVWKNMREKMATMGPLSAQFKVKHLTAMKDYAAQHGFEFTARHQELLDKFSEHAGTDKQAKQDEKDAAKEADQKREEQQNAKEESVRNMRQSFLDEAKKHDTYGSFRQLYNGTPIPAEYRGSQSMDSYLQDVYAEAHGQPVSSERNPYKGRIGATVTFENRDGDEKTGTISKIIDDTHVGVDVPWGKGKGEHYSWIVNIHDINSAEHEPNSEQVAPSAVNPKPGDVISMHHDSSQFSKEHVTVVGRNGNYYTVATSNGERVDIHSTTIKDIVKPADKTQAVEGEVGVGDTIKLRGITNQTFVVTDIKGKMIHVKGEKGGTTVVRKEAIAEIVSKGEATQPSEPKSDLETMTQKELSALAESLRVPAWGSKELLIKRIVKARRARVALEGKTADDLRNETVAELEKIMLDADMLPTEQHHERNKESHIKRLLEWRDGKAPANKEPQTAPQVDEPATKEQPKSGEFNVGDFVQSKSVQMSNGHFGGYDYGYVTEISTYGNTHQLNGHGWYDVKSFTHMGHLPENIREILLDARKTRNYGVTYDGGRMRTVYTNAVLDAYEKGRPLPEEPIQETINAIHEALAKIAKKDSLYQKNQSSRQHDEVRQRYFAYELGESNLRVDEVSILDVSKIMKVEMTDTSTGLKDVVYVDPHGRELKETSALNSSKSKRITNMPQFLRDKLGQTQEIGGKTTDAETEGDQQDFAGLNDVNVNGNVDVNNEPEKGKARFKAGDWVMYNSTGHAYKGPYSVASVQNKGYPGELLILHTPEEVEDGRDRDLGVIASWKDVTITEAPAVADDKAPIKVESFDRREVQDLADFQQVVATLQVGDKVTVLHKYSVTEKKPSRTHKGRYEYTTTIQTRESTGIIKVLNDGRRYLEAIGRNFFPETETASTPGFLLNEEGFTQRGIRIVRIERAKPEGKTQTNSEPAQPTKSLRPLSEDPEKVTPEEFASYVSVARSAIDKLREHIQKDTLPTTQAGLRKLVGEVIGRPPLEDEWSDLMEAAIQEEAANTEIGDQESWTDHTLRYIEIGEKLEKLLKNAGRSIEKAERQQFSTPIPLSAIAAYALNAQDGETVKEGSAGTGSLALPVKIQYAANVKAIELSPRRAAILTALGIEVQNENTFDVKTKVDSVIGNPPFKGENKGKGTVAFAGNPPWKGGWGDLGNRFLAWDLRSIPDGGRLVYVVSPAVIDSRQNAEFRHWLQENHTVRAMVKIHEGGYSSRGTDFGAGLIVVDKGKRKFQPGDQVTWRTDTGRLEQGVINNIDANGRAQVDLQLGQMADVGFTGHFTFMDVDKLAAAPIITGTAENWQDLLNLVKPLGEGEGAYGRVEVESNPGGGRDGGNQTGRTGEGGRGGSGSQTSGVHGSGSSGSGNSSVGSRSGSNGSTKPGREESTAGGNDTVPDGRTSDVVEPQQTGVQDGVQPADQAAGQPNVDRVSRKPKERTGEDVGPDVSGFVEYVPQGGLTGRAHLGQVVETGNLSMIKYPDEIFADAKYRPHDILLNAEGAQKKLSDVQLEAVFLAKYNWHQDKRSLWIADDTGIGKTGEQLANAADAWHTGRAKRILIVTTTDQVATADFMAGNEEFGLKLPITHVNSESHVDFKDEVAEADKSRKDHEKRWTPLSVGDGVMVMSKYTFADSQKAIRDWLDGTKGDALVLVDEAHEFSNVGSNGKPSNRALALAELYRDYNDRAQFLYSSATGAENLDELQYMYGLGLWANEDGFGDFKTRLKGYEPSRSTRSTNQSAMGRAMGATRNPFEREIPLAMMEQMIRELKSEGQYIGRSLSMEGVVLEALPIQLTPEQIGEYNRAVEFISRIADKAEEHNTAPGRGRIMTGVVGYMRRLRGYYAMQAIIKNMKEEIAAGRLSRFVLSGEFKSGDEDLESNRMLSAAIRAINDQEKADGPGGRTVYTTIPEAVDDKDELLEMLAGNHADYDFQKPVPDLPSPIKMLYDAFGDDKVLIITGDVKKDERPAIVKNFQQGKTKVIFFNSAANTGISLHDTIGEQIGFYHVDYPYNAKAAKQSEGRSNRTGQKTKPVIFYPFIAGSLDTKFVGTLLSRSASMGAMSRGKAGKMGDGELDNFEFSGDAAKLAVQRVVPMLDEETRAKMFGEYAARLPMDPDTGEVNPAYIATLFGGEVDVKKFINYIMYLDFEEGGRVIEQYGEAYKEAIQMIEAAGGVVEKFRTFNGREIDKAEGDNITVRHIETILKPAEEAALERLLAKAEEEVATAEEVLANATSETMTAMREQFEKLKEKQDEAQAEVEKREKEATDAFKTRNLYRYQSDVQDAERAVRMAYGDEKKAEAEAELKKAQNALEEAKKNRVTDEQYEKFSQRLTKARDELRKVSERFTNIKGHLENVGRGGDVADAILQQVPAFRRANSTLESKKTRLENIKAQMESNKGATLIEGKIATTGLMVPIRAALRSAAIEHYNTQNPPAAATTVELRGYQLQDGTRAIGVVIPTWAEGAVLERLNVRFAFSGQQGDTDALMKHIQAGNDVDLENGFTLKWRPRDKVVAIVGMTRAKHTDLFTQLQENGHTEDFGFIPQSGMFVVTTEEGLKRLTERFPIKGMENEQGYALASSAGGPPSGSRRNPRKPKAPPTIQQQIKTLTDTTRMLTPKTAHAIADILANELDTLIYQGRVKPGAEGIYNQLRSKAIAVRERSKDSWRVVGHELGHAFSKAQLRIGDPQELTDLMEGLYPNPAKVSKKQAQEEGFAEFFRLWVADTALAQQYAPKTTAAFEQFIANDPHLEPVFAKIRLLVDNDFADTATGRAFAGAVSSEYRNNDNEADDSGTQGPKFQLGWAERKLFKIADFTIPAKHLDKALEEAAKRPDISLRKLLSIMGDNRAKALLTFSSIPMDHKGYKLDGPILQDLYEEGIQHVISYMGNGKVDLNSQEIRKDVAKQKQAKALYKKYRKMGAKDVFDTVLLALRVKERYDTGKHADGSLPITKAHAQEIIDEAIANYPKAIDAAERLTTRFSEINLKLLVDADVITQETADRVKDGSSWYIPFYYVDDKRPVISGSKDAGRTNRQPVKPFKGQVKPTIDAFQAMMMKLMEVHQAIEHKRVMNLLHEMAESGEEAKHFMRMVPKKMDMVKIQSDTIADQIFEKTGIDLTGALLNITHFKFFTPHNELDPNRRTILNVKDGKAVEIQLAKDLFDAIMAMKPVQVAGLGKWMRQLTRVQRFTGLLTLRYLFSTVALRDPGAVLMQSDNPMQNFRHFTNSLGAALGIGKEGEALYESFVQSGAASGAMENMLRNIGKNSFGDEILHLKASGWGKVTIGGKKAWTKVVRSPSEAMRILEEGPRIAEFLATWKREVSAIGHDGNKLWKDYVAGGTDALPQDVQDHMERILVDAAYAAREVTTNFGLHGESEALRKYVPTVPFLQGSVQGFYRFTRQLKAHPARTLATATIGFGAMSLLSYMLMKGIISLFGDDDDEKKRRAQDYNDMDSAMKDKYWWFPVAPGVYLSMAKPFEYAIPANIIERIMDQKYGEQNNRKWNSDMKSLLGTMTNIDVINNVVHVFMDLNANRNSFGGAIVPLSEKDDAKNLQYGPETSMTGRHFSNFITDLFNNPKAGPSPREMDYAVRGLLGRYGTGALNLLDASFALANGQNIPGAVATTKPVGGIPHWPVLGQILYDRSELGGSRQVDKFYRDLDLAKKYASSANTLIEQKNMTLPGWANERGVQLLRAKPMLEAVSSMLSDMNATYKEVINDVTKTPSERESFRLQQNYWRELLTGIPYGLEPTPPAGITKITPAMVDQQTASVIAEINKKVANEAKRKGGPTEQWQYFMWLKNQQK